MRGQGYAAGGGAMGGAGETFRGVGGSGWEADWGEGDTSCGTCCWKK